MSMCRVISCIVGRGCLLWPVCSLGKTVSFCSASFCTPKPKLPITPGISNFFLLYNTVLVLPYINMNLPRVYISSHSQTPLPPPSPYDPSGLSQCTSPKYPVSCIEPRLVIRFLYDIINVSMPFSQIIPPSPSPTESKSLFCTSSSFCIPIRYDENDIFLFVCSGRSYRSSQNHWTSVDESERGQWKSWLKAQHSENNDHGIWSHHFMANRWGNSGNSVRLCFWGLQNHCRWW